MSWQDSDLEEEWLPKWELPDDLDADDPVPTELPSAQAEPAHELTEEWWQTLFAKLQLQGDLEDDELDAEIQAWLDAEEDDEDFPR